VSAALVSVAKVPGTVLYSVLSSFCCIRFLSFFSHILLSIIVLIVVAFVLLLLCIFFCFIVINQISLFFVFFVFCIVEKCCCITGILWTWSSGSAGGQGPVAGRDFRHAESSTVYC